MLSCRRERRGRIGARRGTQAAVLAAALPLAGAGAPTSQTPPMHGFKAYLGAKPAGYTECSVSRGRLSCLVYDAKLPAGAQCSFGGAIPIVEMRARSRATRSSTCVDEGFHGWDTLPVGGTFREGAYTCK